MEIPIIRRENEPVFTMVDVLRFARFLADGEKTEDQIKQIFRAWTRERFKWIEG